MPRAHRWRVASHTAEVGRDGMGFLLGLSHHSPSQIPGARRSSLLQLEPHPDPDRWKQPQEGTCQQRAHPRLASPDAEPRKEGLGELHSLSHHSPSQLTRAPRNSLLRRGSHTDPNQRKQPRALRGDQELGACLVAWQWQRICPWSAPYPEPAGREGELLGLLHHPPLVQRELHQNPHQVQVPTACTGELIATAALQEQAA